MSVANLGDAAGANASYAKSVALRRAVRLARPADEPARLALAEAERRVGDMGVGQGRLDEAVAAYQRALAIVDGPPEPVRDEPWALVASRTRARLGVALNRAGRRDEATRQFEQALALVEPLASGRSVSEAIRQSVMGGHSNLGDVYFYQERYADALKQFEIGLTLARQQAAVAKDEALARRNLHLSTLRVAIALAELGRFDESAAMRDETLAIQSQLVARDPQNVGLQFDLGVTHQQQAIVHLKRKDLASALEEITICLGIFKRLFDSSPAQRGNMHVYAESFGFLGEIELARGQHAEAVAAYRRAIDVMSAPGVEPPKRSDRFVLYKSLGAALDAQAARTGSAEAREEARTAYVTARNGYRALAAAGELADSAKAELAELDRALGAQARK
jgi:tetratricopeptide (TPR) repeat protein